MITSTEAFVLLLASFLCLGGFLKGDASRRTTGQDSGVSGFIFSLLLFGFGIALAQSTTNFTVAPVLMLMIVPALITALWSFGLLLGSLIGRLKTRSRTHSAFFVLVFSLPIALFGLFGYAWYSERQFVVAFNKSTIHGKLGRYEITFPNHPGVGIYHSCNDDEFICFNEWGDYRHGNEINPGDQIHGILLRADDEYMKDLDKWCQSEPADTFNTWCVRGSEHEIRFQKVGFRSFYWRTSKAVIRHEAPEPFEAIVCDRHRQETYRNCRIVLTVDEGLEALAFTNGVSPEQIRLDALTTLTRIDRIWRQLSQQELSSPTTFTHPNNQTAATRTSPSSRLASGAAGTALP